MGVQKPPLGGGTHERVRPTWKMDALQNKSYIKYGEGTACTLTILAWQRHAMTCSCMAHSVDRTWQYIYIYIYIYNACKEVPTKQIKWYAWATRRSGLRTERQLAKKKGLCMAFCLIRSGGDLGIFIHSSSDSGVGQGVGGVVIAPTFWTRLVESPLP